MSLLGKYRKEEERKSDDEDATKSSVEISLGKQTPAEAVVSVPNKERKSPIVSFSIAADLRSCLQAVRNERAINLSMWVERKLRDAVAKEFPDIADEYLSL
ncbi:MAG: hypothetical protein EAX81_02985 [Candidatus Thorarchaeota archaeon]|nr:hypothetical protein [Candidatus Thorarchaeota archaeon]